MLKIKLLDSALEDLWNISIFISIDNPLQSKMVLENLNKSISYLSIFPLIWKERKDWIREIVDKKYKYRVFYKIQNQTVYIISIFKYKDTF